MARRNASITTETVPAATARAQFGQLLELVRANRTRSIVSKNGASVAVILGIEDRLEHVLKIPGALAEIQTDARKRGLDLLTMDDTGAEIRDVRKQAGERRPA